MATFEFKLPDIGEGVTQGEIVSWLIEVGDTVAENQDLVEVMTDKATVTIGSPKPGKILELKGAPGAQVPVGQVLAVIEVEGTGEEPRPSTESKRADPAREGTAASAVGEIKEELPGTSGVRPPARPASPSRPEEQVPQEQAPSDRPLAAPATRRLARELGVDLAQVKPTGPAGRITREDVERHAAAAREARVANESHGRSVGQVAPDVAPVPAAVPAGDASLEERVPLRGLRKRIHDNMIRAARMAAHFTYVDECDVTELVALRSRLQPLAEAEGVRLTFLPFFVKAAITALRKYPMINALIDDLKQEIVVRRYYDIGIATATPAGLIVPVVRRAEQRSLLDLAREIERIASNAREGKTRAEDLGGSSFTLTSLGKFGGVMATSVVNYPEVAIMGLHEIKRQPVVRGESIVAADVMHLTLSCDHRIIDGDVAARFIQETKASLEQPERLFLTMG